MGKIKLLHEPSFRQIEITFLNLNIQIATFRCDKIADDLHAVMVHQLIEHRFHVALSGQNPSSRNLID